MSQPLVLSTIFPSKNFDSSKGLCDAFFKSFDEKQEEVSDLIEAFPPLGDLQTISPLQLIDKWQEMLTLLLTLHECGAISRHKHRLMERMRSLNASFLWREFQLLSVCQALCSHLLGLVVPKPAICQSVEGAAPLEWGKHWSWAVVPHNRFHAELGVLWCLYGYFTQDRSYIEAAEKLANWQLNVLDHDDRPFLGLFSQEVDASELKLFANHFLLFKAVSIFANRPDMAKAAQAQYTALQEHSSSSMSPFSLWQLICDKWLDRNLKVPDTNTVPAVPSAERPSFFVDESLSLVRYSTINKSLVCTLSGGGTGLGCLHSGDVKVVNFGPQHLPLGDCLGFGIEGLANSANQARLTLSESDAFLFEGSVRIAPQPKKNGSRAAFRNGEASLHWTDVQYHFQQGRLEITSLFRGLFDLNTLAFVFFIKAKTCIVDGEKEVKLRSFERYQGELKAITFNGSQSSLKLKAQYQEGSMQVIPLGGGDNFWGADFLIAYLLASPQVHYSWTIE